MSLVVEGMNLTLSKRCIVKDVNLNIEAGEVVGLLGPNGAGKSTIISMMSGLYSQSKGDIYINGKSIATSRTAIANYVGICAPV